MFDAKAKYTADKQAERTDLRLRHDETAGQHEGRERYRHRRKVDGKRHQVELGRENRDRCDAALSAAAAMLILSGCSREASRLHTTAATTTAVRTGRPGRREPECGGDPDCQRGAESGQNRGYRDPTKVRRQIFG